MPVLNDTHCPCVMPNVLGISLEITPYALYNGHMLTLSSVGEEIADKRKKLGLSQTELASRASISRATLESLENGRRGEMGFNKVIKLLTAVGLSLKLQESVSERPTLDDLIEDNRNDQSLDRRR